MLVRDILGEKSGGVLTIKTGASLAEAAELLREHGIGAVVASDDGKRVDGILSERDIVRGLADHGQSLLEMTVSELMTKSVQTCRSDASVNDVMSLMTKGRFRHLPVVDDQVMVGIVSIGDVVKNRLDDLQMETHVLREYIGGRA